MPTLASRLRSERKRLGLTQSQLADLGGVEANAQAHYEKGFRIPRADYLAALAGYGLDLLYVVTGNKTPIETVALSEMEYTGLMAFRMLGEKEQNAIIVIMLALTPPPYLAN
ncbi:MAG: helix-turn-helix domain-containing protein [Pseudomonas sp.]|uniref:helix-turn-helix domain-containing protein n=1 Tax=Pseudomonas sp. UMAB-08 TaxID=1365375 RepID=UPI001C568ADC|nr:helix-turn-helix transcriptional regulator [Pseudomonas sp. UMAB-08]